MVNENGESKKTGIVNATKRSSLLYADEDGESKKTGIANESKRP